MWDDIKTGNGTGNNIFITLENKRNSKKNRITQARVCMMLMCNVVMQPATVTREVCWWNGNLSCLWENGA